MLFFGDGFVHHYFEV